MIPKRDIRRTIFYWLMTVTVVTWCFTMLYIHSWNVTWAGKNGDEEVARKEELALREKANMLTEMEAPDKEIVEARINLAKRLLQNGKHMLARDAFDDADGVLAKSKSQDSQATLLKRAELQRLAAIPFRDSSFFEFGYPRFARAGELLDKAEQDDDVHYLKLALLNDEGVYQYLWANASERTYQRNEHYALAERKLQKCLTECRFQLSEANSTERARYQRLARTCATNLSEVLRDLGRTAEAEGIEKLAGTAKRRT